MTQIYTTAAVDTWEMQPNCNVKKRWDVLDQDGNPIDISSGYNIDLQMFPSTGYGSGNGIFDGTAVGSWTKGNGFIEVEYDASDLGGLALDAGNYSLFAGATGSMGTNRALVAYGNFYRIQIVADINGGI